MKRIEAFIKPHRISKTVSALHALPSFPGFTILHGHGQGHGRGADGHYVYEPDKGLLFHTQAVLIVVCSDQDAASISDAIARAAHTGNKGDGIVIISDVQSVLRVRDAGGAP